MSARDEALAATVRDVVQVLVADAVETALAPIEALLEEFAAREKAFAGTDVGDAYANVVSFLSSRIRIAREVAR